MPNISAPNVAMPQVGTGGINAAMPSVSFPYAPQAKSAGGKGSGGAVHGFADGGSDDNLGTFDSDWNWTPSPNGGLGSLNPTQQDAPSVQESAPSAASDKKPEAWQPGTPGRDAWDWVGRNISDPLAGDIKSVTDSPLLRALARKAIGLPAPQPSASADQSAPANSGLAALSPIATAQAAPATPSATTPENQLNPDLVEF